MFINSLLWQGNGEAPLLVAVLLDLGSLVLEPDLQLRLGQSQLTAEVLPPLLGQVLVGQELSLKSLQLFSVKCSSWFLLCATWLTVFCLPLSLSSGPSTGRSVGVPGGKHPGGDVGQVGQRLGGDIGGVGRMGQVHGQLVTLGFSLDDDGFDGGCYWRCGGLVTSKVRTKNVINGEGKIAAGAWAWVVRRKWYIGVWRTAAPMGYKILFSLFLLELAITDECIHDDEMLALWMSRNDWLTTVLTRNI